MSITKISAAMSDLDGAVTINESSADADFRIESNGLSHALFVDGGNDKVIINHTTTVSQAGVAPQFQVHGTGSATSSISATRNSNDTGGPYLILSKSRGTSTGAVTVVQDDDILGQIMFAGADGGDLAPVGASIQAFVDGTPGTDDMPGRLVFSTTADGAQTATERLRIDASGNVGIGISPSAKLHVDGSEDYTGGIVISAGAQLHSWFLSSDLVNVHNVHSASASAAHTWQLSGTEVVRITPNGITFNGDTAAANALDDYEEGTATISIEATTTNPTITEGNTFTAQYTKIGNMVTVRGYTGTRTITNAGSGLAKINQLPFTNHASYYGVVSIVHGTMFGDTQAGYVEANTTFFYPIQEGSTSGVNYSTGSSLFMFSVTYMVA